jgi:hypothetical protein
MGYTTDFNGSLKLSRAATPEEISYINDFNSSRRMKRNVDKLMELYNGKYGYPFAAGNTPEEIYGIDGEYFIGDKEDESVIDYNCPPGQTGFLSKSNKAGQPGLWCQWSITNDGLYLEWDGGEKFYNYIEWLRYLIKHFFERWGVKLNGEIEWYGEDPSDIGIIIVNDNNVRTKSGRIVYEYDDDEVE